MTKLTKAEAACGMLSIALVCKMTHILKPEDKKEMEAGLPSPDEMCGVTPRDTQAVEVSLAAFRKLKEMYDAAE